MINKSIEFLMQIDSVKDISEAAMNRAKRSLLDYLAVTCAGSAFQSEKIKKYYEFAEPEHGAYKAIGTGKNVVLDEAVFLNGLNGHALDFDDGTNSGIIHLGSPIFALLIPLAQKYDIGVTEMLRAAVIGYEASYTMAISIQPGHKQMGYHATGTCGTLGATLAAAYMLGFDEEERFQAFAAACVAASGMLKVLDDGSELKPYNVAKTALLSLMSLKMAKAGFKGHSDPLGGRGFIKMMTGKDSIELKPVLIGGTYAIEKSYTKPYASCRYTHPSVEAAIRMRNKYRIAPDSITGIDIKTYSLAVSGHDHTDIPGSYSAKMSIPYSTAVALIYGKAGLQEFEEGIVNDSTVKSLTKKISVSADENMSNSFPEKQTAEVEISTDKEIYKERVDFPKGEPENPLTDEEFKQRYDALMSYGNIDENSFNKVFDLVYSDNANMNEIVRNL